MIVLGLSGLPRAQARHLEDHQRRGPAADHGSGHGIDTFSRIALDRLYIEGFVVEPTTTIDPPAPVPGSAG